MRPAAERAARLEAQADELERAIAIHAITADLHLRAAATLRLKQADLRALADLARSEELRPLMPLSAAVPALERRAG